MADDASMALEEWLRKAQLSDDVDFLRKEIRALVQALPEAAVTQQVNAGRYERTPPGVPVSATAHGNGAGTCG